MSYAFNPFTGNFDDTPGVVTTTEAGILPATSFAAITYASTITLDMAALNMQVRKIAVTGPLTLAVSNIADGQRLSLRLVVDETDRTLTVPAWSRYGYNSTTLKANKVYRLALEIHGTASLDQIDLAIAEKI